MIKYLVILFILSGCTTRDYLEMPSAIYQAIRGADVEISDSFIDTKDFSFIKITIGRNIAATMTLVEIDNDIYEWVGENSAQRIYTKHGKIIKTIGLEHNVKVLDHYKYSLRSEVTSGQYLVHLSQPVGVFAQNFQIMKIDASKYKKSLLDFFQNRFTEVKFYIDPKYVIEEKFNTEFFRWNGKNIYWLDENLNVIRSVQTIHPNLSEISIDYFYKY